LEAFGNLGFIVDGDDASSAKEESTADRKLAHRTATPYCHGIVGLNVALLSRHITGRENV
jgi:hypothetical protein